VLGIAGIALATTWLRTDNTQWRLILAAVTLTAVLAAVGYFMPWRRLPAWLVLALPISCDGLIALLRHAQGGNGSGYAVLTILPAVWVALAYDRRAVLALTASSFATLALPILLISGEHYPATAWRGVVLLTIVTGVVGLVTHQVVSEQHRLARLADERTRVLDRLLQTQTAIATSRLDLEHVMTTVIGEAIELTGAAAAVVEVPDGDQMVYRAVGGAAAPYLGLRVPRAGSLSGECLALQQTLVTADSETDPRADRDACRQVGARSLVVVPLVHDDHAAGVLKIYSPVAGAIGWPHARVLQLLAHVIGTGLVRAELVETLERHAHTDKLTGLPNRRSWDDQLMRALARADRADEPLSVAICDVDGLKQVNDLHGHAAGDVLLQDVARSLRRAARAGDVVARVGGDEFAVLLIGADGLGAIDAVERLTEGLPPDSSVSVGVAEWDRTESGDALVARADARMYRQKTRARRVRVSPFL
jgi:diguanylate cyclase